LIIQTIKINNLNAAVYNPRKDLQPGDKEYDKLAKSIAEFDYIDPVILKSEYSERLVKAGFNVLNSVEHNFKPQGYTVLFLLAESHLAIHTFPEENKTYIELSSCVKDKFDKFVAAA